MQTGNGGHDGVGCASASARLPLALRLYGVLLFLPLQVLQVLFWTLSLFCFLRQGFTCMDQADLKLTDLRLPLPPCAGIAAMVAMPCPLFWSPLRCCQIPVNFPRVLSRGLLVPTEVKTFSIPVFHPATPISLIFCSLLLPFYQFVQSPLQVCIVPGCGRTTELNKTIPALKSTV